MIFQGSFFFEFARWTIGASRFGIMVPFSGNWSESPFSMACLFLSPARQILKLFRPTFEFGSLRLQYNFWHIQTHQEGRSESRDIISHLSERTWNHSLLGQTSYSSNILQESCTIMIFNIKYILYRQVDTSIIKTATSWSSICRNGANCSWAGALGPSTYQRPACLQMHTSLHGLPGWAAD